jgi:acetyl-CoA carboxylase biotin carboxylase subunit
MPLCGEIPSPVFKKVLIANRGEIALRVIRACKELGIRTVAVYSDADRWSNYVSQAEEAYAIGPAPARESYLRMDKILEIARKSGAQAIHPGYGFLSENADFSEACAKADLKFIGPGPATMRAVGNKIAARKTAQKLGVPVVPGISGQVDEPQVLAFGKEHGYPILLKAAGGGGGKGLRVVREEKDVARALREASSEAGHAFGNSTVFVEKYIDKPRHVEIQVFGDTAGQVVHLFERECSVQRRYQKVIEEAPAPALGPGQREALTSAAVAFARAIGYVNLGTVEFMVDARTGEHFFLEMNCRIQVEHPVTEEVTGRDLVAEQLRIAAGEPLGFGQDDVRLEGHAVEARLTAEDVAHGFRPSPGRLRRFAVPDVPNLRVDTHCADGTLIPPHYDSLMAKLIGRGPDRASAVRVLGEALDGLQVEGVETNRALLQRVLGHDDFTAGTVTTRWLEEEALA